MQKPPSRREIALTVSATRAPDRHYTVTLPRGAGDVPVRFYDLVNGNVAFTSDPLGHGAGWEVAGIAASQECEERAVKAAFLRGKGR